MNSKQSEMENPPFLYCGFIGIRFFLVAFIGIELALIMEKINESGNLVLYEFFYQLVVLASEKANHFLNIGKYYECQWAELFDIETDLSYIFNK